MSPLDLIQIAKLAQVSRSTVSRVVNEHPDVKPEVRERVQKIIRETGYQPNFAARSLRSKTTDVLGLVISNTVDGLFGYPYFQPLVDGVMQACNQQDKTLALFLAGDPDAIFPRLTRRGYLDGILLQAGKTDDTLLKKILTTEMPCVYFGRPTLPNVNYVDVDNVGGARLATAHLLGLGRQRVALIGAGLDNTTGIDRHRGYLEALGQAGQAELIVHGDYTESSGYRAMQNLLAHRPDAVFAANDAMALGALRAIQEAGLAVPGDVALVGFDDLPPATARPPLLTTIRQPVHEVGMRAAGRLLELIHNPAQPAQQIILDVALVVRETA